MNGLNSLYIVKFLTAVISPTKYYAIQYILTSAQVVRCVMLDIFLNILANA